MNNYLLAGLVWGFFIGIASTAFLIWLTDVKFKKHIKQMVHNFDEDGLCDLNEEGQPKD